MEVSCWRKNCSSRRIKSLNQYFSIALRYGSLEKAWLLLAVVYFLKAVQTLKIISLFDSRSLSPYTWNTKLRDGSTLDCSSWWGQHHITSCRDSGLLGIRDIVTPLGKLNELNYYNSFINHENIFAFLHSSYSHNYKCSIYATSSYIFCANSYVHSFYSHSHL